MLEKSVYISAAPSVILPQLAGNKKTTSGFPAVVFCSPLLDVKEWVDS